jgi:hypothetical protein
MNNIFSLNTFAAGLLVGTLDICAASFQFFIKTGNGPSGLLKYVASGFFGAEAFNSGNSMIFWGLFFHYFIALSFTFFFFWLVKIFPGILKEKILTAVLYGVFMWVVTQVVVVPLSKIPTKPLAFGRSLIAISILVICISIPLTWIANRQLQSNNH